MQRTDEGLTWGLTPTYWFAAIPRKGEIVSERESPSKELHNEIVLKSIESPLLKYSV